MEKIYSNSAGAHGVLGIFGFVTSVRPSIHLAPSISFPSFWAMLASIGGMGILGLRLRILERDYFSSPGKFFFFFGKAVGRPWLARALVRDEPMADCLYYDANDLHWGSRMGVMAEA